MRRWDVIGLFVGIAISAFDLGVFALAGLDVASLASSAVGWMVLGGFVSGYGLLGWASGRLLMARQRSKADAEQIQAQLEALEEGRAELAQSEKLAALGRLAAGIAHEVRNPLGVIRASASMVQESFDEGTDDHRACGMITDEIDRLDGLIGALLAFARPAPMKLSQTSLSAVVRRAMTLAMEARDVHVDADAVPDESLRADGDLLTQLLFGFFVNAAEAGARTVAVRSARAGSEITLEIADDGAGIALEDEARVFEPFFTTKDTGTGLGLPMAARIVGAHGGHIEIVQGRGLGERGRGACFAIHLPISGPAHLTEAA